MVSMADFPYAEVGATEFDELPAGYRHVRRHVRLATRDFARVGDAVMRFELQRRVGLRPVTSAPRAAVGVDVTGRLGVGRFGIPVPCRVVWVREDETAIGFGYGTLATHPECGEEAFVVTRADDGSVWLDIRAFSRPAAWYATLAGPAGRLLQSIVTDLYVRAGRRV
jgi:uncharacterized protein (UPF0548 family)